MKEGAILATHVLSSHRQNRRHNEDDLRSVRMVPRNWSTSKTTHANEQSPDASPAVDEIAGFAHVPGARLKLAENDLAENWDTWIECQLWIQREVEASLTVAPVESDGSHVEHTSNGRVRSETDQVDRDAPEDRDPKHG